MKLRAGLLAMLVFSQVTLAAPKKKQAPSLSAGTANVENPLNVKGQTRNLSMALVLKNRDDQIKFIKIRRDFREEILTTPY